MGRAKQLLEVDGRPMVRAVLEPLTAARVAGVCLVTYRELATRIELGHLKGVFLAHNEDENSEMIDSIRIGLRAWRERATIGDRDGFLVCPADQPGIATADLDACVAAFAADPGRIVIACRAGRRGHPIIFPGALAGFVESAACDKGLNALPRAHADRVELVECQSTGVGRDVDTPAEYDRLG